MLRFYRVVGTKKFAVKVLILLIPIVFWFANDPNFFAIITWPDNVPISLLIMLVLFFTWYALYRCAENDKRIEAGLGPIEGTEENREKVWCWPNLVYTELFAIIAGTIFLIVWADFV